MAGLDEVSVREGVDQETVDAVRSVGERYKYGFSSDIATEFAPKGLNEDIVRLISEKNGEPEWMTDWRLKAYRRWLQMEEPHWAMLHYPEIDFQDAYYYARPASMSVKPKSLDEVDPDAARDLREAGDPAEGADDPGRGRGRGRGSGGRPAGRGGRGVRFRVAGDDVQGGAGEGRGDLLPDLRGGARSIRSWCRNISAASCLTATTSMRR